MMGLGWNDGVSEVYPQILREIRKRGGRDFATSKAWQALMWQVASFSPGEDIVVCLE